MSRRSETISDPALGESIDRREPSAGGGDPDGFAGGAGVLPRGIEYYGLGQSGYTAGRQIDDPALRREIEVEPVAFPRGVEAAEVLSEPVADDRFTGRGRRLLDEDERVRREPPPVTPDHEAEVATVDPPAAAHRPVPPLAPPDR